MNLKNLDFDANFRSEEIIQKKWTKKKVDPKTNFWGLSFSGLSCIRFSVNLF